jgi:charged multivesicular body protein 3
MSLSFLFGKTIKPEEVVRKWQRELRKEERNIDRSIRDLEREEQKVKLEIKQMAKRGDQKTARILAKQIVQSRKAKERMYTSKAELHSISLALTHQLATMKVSGVLAKSASVMKSMNDLIKLPAIQQTMMAMGREMEKMGLIEEIMDDALTLDDDEEDEAQEEIDKVLDNILMDIRPVPAQPVPVAAAAAAQNTQEDVDLQARLQALSAI